MKKILALLGIYLVSLSVHASSPEQREFIQHWQGQGLSADYIEASLAQATFQQSIIDSITRPWEAKPWYQYYPLFLTEARLEAGIKFWHQHHETLAQAEKELGVEAEMIVAIIGIETFYGRYLGKHAVLDALYTLGFHYPPRQTFFRKELGHFLQLAQEQNWAVTEPKGSYAGAMGLGQFISSSYQAYAIDFDNDGQRDLIHNPVDAIGSVANYFAKHGWQKDAGVTQQIDVAEPIRAESILWDKKKLHHSAEQLAQHGVKIDPKRTGEFGLLKLQTSAEQSQYYLVEPNFYAITRYNHSPLYAMAAWQFSQQLKQAFDHE